MMRMLLTRHLPQYAQRCVKRTSFRPRAVVQPLPSISGSLFRYYSQELPLKKTASYQDIKAHIANPVPNRVLIDTREPAELEQTGTIPGSINIPIKSRPDSFHITEEEFEDRFGFERPGKDQEIVLYCKAGVRSRAAAELARQQGWVNVVEYEGSWLDWERNGGERQTRP